MEIKEVKRLDEDRFEVQYKTGRLPAKKVYEDGNLVEDTPAQDIVTPFEGSSLSHLNGQITNYLTKRAEIIAHFDAEKQKALDELDANYELQVALKAEVESKPILAQEEVLNP